MPVSEPAPVFRPFSAFSWRFKFRHCSGVYLPFALVWAYALGVELFLQIAAVAMVVLMLCIVVVMLAGEDY